MAEKIETEVRVITSEGQVLKFLNKERKRSSRISKRIEMNEWRQHFKEQLEGTDEKHEEINREMLLRRADESELAVDEIESQMRKLKKGKACGTDRIPNKAWLHCGCNARDRVKVVVKRVWRGEGFPDVWRKGIISAQER